MKTPLFHTNLTAVIPAKTPDLSLLFEKKWDQDRAKILLHSIYSFWISAETNERKRDNYFHKEGWVELSSKWLEKVVGANYKEIEDVLEAHHIIDIKRNINHNKSYVPRERSTPYRFNTELISGVKRFKKEKISSHKPLTLLHKHIEENKERMISEAPITSVDVEKVHNMLFKFWFDTEGLNNYLDELSQNPDADKKKLQNLYDLEPLTHLINNRQIDVPIIDNFGERVHSVFTRLPSEFRKFLQLRGSDEKLVNVDVSNSQPFMFTLISCFPDISQSILPEFKPVFDKIKKVAISKRRHYLELSKTGEIYEYWAIERGFDKITKDETKQRKMAKYEIIKRILFAKKNYKHKQWKKARELFEHRWGDVSQIMDIIKSATEQELPFIEKVYLNKKGVFAKEYHKSMSCMCQRLESRIFIKEVVSELINLNITLVSIHDSVLVPESKVDLVKSIIKEKFEQYGFPAPKIKDEYLDGTTEH